MVNVVQNYGIEFQVHFKNVCLHDVLVTIPCIDAMPRPERELDTRSFA